MAFVQVQCLPTFQNGEPNTEAETSQRVLNTDHIIVARAFGESTTHVTLAGNLFFVVDVSLEDFYAMLAKDGRG